jgi:glucan-binding YG repeat protein
MKTGWAEWKGEKYYLNPVSDGWMGRMLTGWQEIDGKRYYFETVPGNNQGRMYRSEGTPDGYYVGADGVWQ